MKSSIYQGKPQENGFSGAICEGGIFGVIAIFDGYTQERGEDLIHLITEQFNAEPNSLSQFESYLSDLIHKANVPVDFSIALGVRKENGIYLKTFGTGSIILIRKGAIVPLISGNNIASGLLEKNDTLVFTTDFFLTTLKGKTHLHKLLTHRTPIEHIGARLKTEAQGVDDTGAVALFVEPETSVSPVGRGGNSQKVGFIQERGRVFYQAVSHIRLPKKKLFILGAVLLAIGGLVINTFLWGGKTGNGRATSTGPIQLAQTAIAQAEAAEDLVSATGILSTMRTQIKNNSKSRTQKQTEEASQALQQLAEAEKKLLNISEPKASVYYDFSLEEKNVIGTQMTLSNGKLIVSDTEGRLFTVDMDGKSVEVVESAKLKGVTRLGAEDRYAYPFTPKEGVFRVDGKEVKQVIKPDDLWSLIAQLQVYNGNIYMLDPSNNALYKYAGYDGGWGGRQSYFKGSYDDLSDSVGFSIRISVFIAGKTGVAKYTAGIKDDFILQYPAESVLPSGIITPEQETDIYIWDKTAGAILIFGEKGEYKKQVRTDGLKKAADVEVTNGVVYYLVGGLIYSMPL